MKKITIFNTPILRLFFKILSLAVLKVSGWKLTGCIPEEKKMVIIFAPHTSNWDMPLAIFLAFARNLNPTWLGKNGIFRFPFKHIMKWLGGIPVYRSERKNMVEQISRKITEREKILLALAPEGTRKRVDHWKSGFYHIALNAEIPILCAYLDYHRKEAGFGPMVMPTGAQDADIAPIKEFYSQKSGRFPDKFNKKGIRLRGKNNTRCR